MGKFMRAFRRQTDEVRSVIEREFYRMDQDVADFDLGKPSRPAIASGKPGELPEPIPEPTDPVQYPPHDEFGHPLPLQGSSPPLSDPSLSPSLSLEETPTHIGPRGTVPAGSSASPAPVGSRAESPPPAAPESAETHDEVTQVHERSPADTPALSDENPLGRNRNSR
jgi:sec-independent protein translocase protein TatB